jgi:hypothetical protein
MITHGRSAPSFVLRGSYDAIHHSARDHARKRLVALVHTSKPHAWRDAIPSTSSASGHTAAPVVSKVLVSIAQRVIRFGTCPVLTARGC